MKAAIGLYLVLGVSMSSAPLHAGIYTWVDARGKTHFSDRPPPGGKAKAVTVDDNVISGSGAAARRLAAASASNANAGQARVSAQVVMYSASWCGYCRQARALLNKRGVPFKEYDIETSAQGEREYARLGGRGVPLLLIGSDRIDGFDAGRVNSLLNKAGL